jgi:hypothetical protein
MGCDSGHTHRTPAAMLRITPTHVATWGFDPQE